MEPAAPESINGPKIAAKRPAMLPATKAVLFVASIICFDAARRAMPNRIADVSVPHEGSEAAPSEA